MPRIAASIASIARRLLHAMHLQRSENDEEIANFLALRNLSISGWYDMERKELAPGFPIASSDSIVDIGCGLGNASLFAARQGAEVVSLDIDPSAIANIEQKMCDVQPKSFQAIVSDSNPVPLPAACATVVLAMEVLEHVDEPAVFLAELLRIGKPGARYLISVPDPASEGSQRKIAPSSYWKKPNHLRVFGRDEFRAAVESAGLIVEQQFFYGFYSTMWWSLRWAVEEDEIPFGQAGHSELLSNWNKTWKTLLTQPQGKRIWEAFEEAMPKSQAIIARKPGK